MIAFIKKLCPKWLALAIKRRKWRNANKNNETYMMNNFNANNVMVGDYSYGELKVVSFAKNTKLIIGSYVSIAQEVVFIMDAEHHLNHISTYPFKVKMLQTESAEAFSKGNIVIDDDVWIGYGATILSGVHVGQGAVIAARSVVTKDIPPYAIVGGNPARIIRYRFEEPLINDLLKVDYNKLTKDMVSNHIDDLYEVLEEKSQLDWIPKKNGKE